MKLIKITGFEKYQHYSGRHMIWFKFYVDCLQDYHFMELSEREKWVFMGLICLACRSGNEVEYRVDWLERVLNTRKIVKSITRLSASNMIAICYRDKIRKDKIREDKIRGEKSKAPLSLTKEQIQKAEEIQKIAELKKTTNSSPLRRLHA